jgi:hypothetical protein
LIQIKEGVHPGATLLRSLDGLTRGEFVAAPMSRIRPDELESMAGVCGSTGTTRRITAEVLLWTAAVPPIALTLLSWIDSGA